MPPANKWTSGDSPQQPITVAAIAALSTRLLAVGEYLEKAATDSSSAVENVHQLRVWSRRATAALDTFRSTLPPRRRKRLWRWLKRIRRAAGVARDCDVLLARLAARPGRTGDHGGPEVRESLQAMREAAQRPIRRMHRQISTRYARRVKRLLERIEWRGKGRPPSFAAAAREQLAPVATQFFAAADGDLSDVQALHHFRIAGKRLRYAMELFAAAFPASFREELYPLVEELQEKLGEINDHAAAAAQFERWQAELAPPASIAALRLLRGEKRALSRCRQAFFAWWTKQRAADLQKRFGRALAVG